MFGTGCVRRNLHGTKYVTYVHMSLVPSRYRQTCELSGVAVKAELNSRRGVIYGGLPGRKASENQQPQCGQGIHE